MELNMLINKRNLRRAIIQDKLKLKPTKEAFKKVNIKNKGLTNLQMRFSRMKEMSPILRDLKIKLISPNSRRVAHNNSRNQFFSPQTRNSKNMNTFSPSRIVIDNNAIPEFKLIIKEKETSSRLKLFDFKSGLKHPKVRFTSPQPLKLFHTSKLLKTSPKNRPYNSDLSPLRSSPNSKSPAALSSPIRIVKPKFLDPIVKNMSRILKPATRLRYEEKNTSSDL